MDYETRREVMDRKKEVYPVYQPKEDPVKTPMKVAVLFSGGASSVPFMVEGKTYEVIGAISSNKNASGIKKLENIDIPVAVNDIHDFYGKFSKEDVSDMKIRRDYDKQNLFTLTEKLWLPDIVACSGYMYFLTNDFLNAYWNKIINVHPADLSILNERGERKYTGDNAVRDALEAGETSTASTIHIMDDQPDHGPIVCISEHLPIKDRDYKNQQELMKEKCDGPAYKKALELFSTGKVFFDENDSIFIKTYSGDNGEYIEHDL